MRALHVLQLTSKSAGGVRGKLVAREIDILQRELHTKAVVYIMGRAHVRMRSHPKSVLDWSVYIPCRWLVCLTKHICHLQQQQHLKAATVHV